MNILDAYITKITGEPYLKYDKWCLPVEYDCYGSLLQTSIMCNSKEDALEIKVGHKFQV